MATRACLFLLLLVWGSTPGANAHAQQPLSALEGVVVTDDAASIPLRKVRVAVTWTGGEAVPVFTDERGRFSVAIASGVYHTIALSKAGYAPQRVGREPGDAASLVLRMPKGAAISGLVIDPSGAPVSRVPVRVRRASADGTAYSTGEYQASTDDRGAFRLGSLPAGRYAVMISGAGTRPVLGDPVDPDAMVDIAAGGEVGVVRIHEGAGATERLVTSFAAGFNAGARPPSGENPSRSSAVIEGRALDESGRAAPAVLVRAVAVTGSFGPVAATDADGRYALEVPPGTYRLVANRATPQALSIPQDGPGHVVVVGSGERLSGVDVTYRAGGIITGSVVDEDGEPLEGFLVQASRATRRAGSRQVGPIFDANARRTDDRGEYRLFDLPPGSYYVMTRAASSEIHTATLRQVEVLYPSTILPSAAVPVTVHAGAESHATITASPGRLARVEGRIFDAAGRPFTGQVTLVPRAPDGQPVTWPRHGKADDGLFSFSSVPPGDYVVRASGNITAPEHPDVTTAPLQFGVVRVSAAADATASVTVRLSLGSVLHGRVVVAGSPGAAPPAGVEVLALATDPELSGIAELHAQMQPDGTFEISDLFGPARIVIDAPAGWRLQSTYVDGTNAADDPVVFGTPRGSRSGVEVVITRGGAAIAGRVTGEATASAGALVAVGPADPERWHERSRYVQLTTADGQGRFAFENLPGSLYIVVAIDASSLTPGQRGLLPEDVRRLLPSAEHVSLVENGHATVDVRVTRLPE